MQPHWSSAHVHRSDGLAQHATRRVEVQCGSWPLSPLSTTRRCVAPGRAALGSLHAHCWSRTRAGLRCAARGVAREASRHCSDHGLVGASRRRLCAGARGAAVRPPRLRPRPPRATGRLAGCCRRWPRARLQGGATWAHLLGQFLWARQTSRSTALRSFSGAANRRCLRVNAPSAANKRAPAASAGSNRLGRER